MGFTLTAAGLAEAGVFGAYYTEAKGGGEIIAVLSFGSESFIVPIKKNVAFVDSGLYGTQPSTKAISVLNGIFSAEPEGSPLHGCSVQQGQTTTRSKRLKGLIEPCGVECSAVRSALSNAGYVLPIAAFPGSNEPKRDFSDTLKNPETLRRYEEDKAEFEKLGIGFDTLPEKVKTNFEGIKNGSYSAMILCGRPGNGKSTICRRLAVELGTGATLISISGGTTVEQLFGDIVPNTDPDSPSKIKFAPGPITRAFCDGGIIIADELFMGSPEILSALNPVLDGSPTIEVNGNIYHRNPNFFLFATTNPGAAGTQEINYSLKDRLAVIQIAPTGEEDFCRILGDYTESLGLRLSDGFFRKLYKFSESIADIARKSGYHENVVFTLRSAKSVCSMAVSRRLSEQEFADVINANYIDKLSMDNDNYDKVAALWGESLIKGKISAMYSEYAAGVVKAVDPKVNFDDVVAAATQGTAANSFAPDIETIFDTGFGDNFPSL